MQSPIAIIGFGEAGETFTNAASWSGAGRSFDIDASRRPAIIRAGLEASPDAESALRDAVSVLSLVTAGEALAAVANCTPFIRAGAFWFDMNSAAPDTKRAAAAMIEVAGGRYVDVAVVAPVNPARLTVPLLVASAYAEVACDALRALGFTNVRSVGGEVGRASAIKMIRSVMIKGIEALTDEMMAAARAAGVEDEVLSSLDASEKNIGWRERAAYNIERMATHGIRRAEEMEESANTLRSLGVEPTMTVGTVRRQRAAARTTTKAEDAA